jgi:hypothetical protein
MLSGDWPGLASLWGASIGFDVWAAAAASPAELAARQAARLASLLRVAARIPRYAPLLAGRDPARVPLNAMPPTSKHEMMARFAEGVADPALELPAAAGLPGRPRPPRADLSGPLCGLGELGQHRRARRVRAGRRRDGRL